MKEEKICPISFANDESDVYCKRERCAWWDEANGMCALVSIARALDAQRYVMEESLEQK